MVKNLPGSILHCRTDTGAGSDGFAIIRNQQFYRLVCDPPHGNLRGRTANFRGPASSQLYISGGFTGKKMSLRCITAKAFSYPHTEFGALRSRRLGVMSATN